MLSLCCVHYNVLIFYTVFSMNIEHNILSPCTRKDAQYQNLLMILERYRLFLIIYLFAI